MATSQTVERSPDGKDGGGCARLEVLAGADLAIGHRTADRRQNVGDRINPLRAFERADLGLGPAQDAQPAAHRGERRFGRAQIALGRGQVGLALLPVLQRGRFALIQAVFALLVGLGQLELRARGIQRAGRTDKVVLRLCEFCRVDGEQAVAALDLVAEFGDDSRDPAGIGRKHGRRLVAVDGNLAVRKLLGAKTHFDHRRELELRQLRRRRFERAGGRRRRFRRSAGGFGKDAHARMAEPQRGNDGDGRDGDNGDLRARRQRACRG